MTRVYLLCMVMCWPAVSSADDPIGMSLDMSLDKTSVVFGLPITVKLKIKNNGENMPDVELTKFETNFIVRNVERNRYSAMEAGRRITTHETRFRLYARRPGTFQLPSIRWGAKHTQAVAIDVLPHGPNGPHFSLSVTTENARPRLRQSVRVEIKLVSEQNLNAEPEVLNSPNFSIRELPTQRERQVHGADTRYVTRFSWSVMPLKPGLHKLYLPLVTMGGRRLLPSGDISFNITPLADYIPTFVPVGTLFLKTENRVTAGWLNEPQNWQVRVSGDGLSREAIAHFMSEAIRNTESIRFYPAEYVIEDYDPEGLASRSILVSIPFVPLQAGELRLPELNIPFVDPKTGHLDKASIPSEAIDVRSPLRVGLLISGVVLLALVLLLWLLRQVRAYLHRHRQLRATLKAVEAADSPDTLAHGLLTWTGAVSQPKYQTLTRWLGVFSTDSRKAEIERLVEKLERWRWRQPDNKQDFENLKQQFTSILR